MTTNTSKTLKTVHKQPILKAFFLYIKIAKDGDFCLCPKCNKLAQDLMWEDDEISEICESSKITYNLDFERING